MGIPGRVVRAGGGAGGALGCSGAGGTVNIKWRQSLKVDSPPGVEPAVPAPLFFMNADHIPLALAVLTAGIRHTIGSQAPTSIR